MKLGDIPAMLNNYFTDELPHRLPSVRGVLAFECAMRGIVSQMMGLHERMGASYQKAPPLIGMSACFELCNGFQINSTMTGLAFGESRA
jgi:hypothetical protein